MKTPYILTLASFLLLLTSCRESFLEQIPESYLTDVNFFKTEDDFRQALNGAYDGMRKAMAGRSSWIMGEMRSDNTHYDVYLLGATINNAQAVADFIDDAQNVHSNDKYYQCYAGISRANTIISRLALANLKPEANNEILGQAKFIRALLYFDLVRYFGGVSLYKEEVKGITDSYLPRSSKEETYAFILEDVQDAIAKLPEPSFPQTGRATQGSARMLLAYIYMTQKEYAKAEPELKKITAMGYTLLNDYASLFDPAYKNSQESILEAQYQQGNQGQQSDFIYYFIPPVRDTKPITGVVANNSAFNSMSGGWNVPTPEMISTYEPGDERLDASIGIVEGTGQATGFVAESVKSIVGYTTPAGKTAKPFIRKYLHAHTQPFNTNDNWPVYRYADALLLLAEALNEQGKSGEALEYLNQVRRRAGLAEATNSSQSGLRDIIAHERRVELAFENHRWLDLVRTDKAIEVLTQHGEYLKSLYPSLQPRTYNLTADQLIFPIPSREIQINSQLTQNPR